MMPRTPRVLAAFALVLAGCSDLTGSGLTGHWATEGLELSASTLQSELRLPCATVASLPPLRIDATGHFELSGPASHTYGSFIIVLRGQVVRDTIQADVTMLADGARPMTTHYVLVRGADPAFERFGCLGSARLGAA